MIAIELWWLLALPVFFSLGWIAARIDLKHLLRESRALPRSRWAVVAASTAAVWRASVWAKPTGRSGCIRTRWIARA